MAGSTRTYTATSRRRELAWGGGRQPSGGAQLPSTNAYVRSPLWFAKTLADCEINDIASSRQCSVITPSHVSIHLPVPRNAGSPPGRPSEPVTRESGATSTTRRHEASAPAAKTRFARQALLGRLPAILVRMATIPDCGHARNRGALAQGRIPFVLEADFQSQEAH